MKSTRHYLYWKMMIIFIFQMFLPTTFSNAAETMKQLLIINSYNEGDHWSQNRVRAALILASQFENVDADVIHMNGVFIKTDEQFRQAEENIMQYAKDNKPDYLLIIGNLAFNMRDRIQKEWGDIPILLFTDADLYGPREYFFTGQASQSNDKCTRSLSELQGKYNFTMLETRIRYKETIDMMVQMLPKMKTLIFAADGLYMNCRLNRKISSYIKSRYPHLKYEHFTALKDQNNRLYQLLLTKNSEYGILFSTWFYERNNIQGMPSIITGEYRLAASSPLPIFSLRKAYLDNGGSIGGYYSDSGEMEKQLNLYLTQIIEGKQARDIPFYYSKNSYPLIDYEQLQLKGIPEENCPENTVFINKPLTFWEAHAYHIIIGGCILVILLILLTSKYVYQQKRITLLEAYRKLLKNMPVAYFQGKVISGKDNKATDVAYIVGNTAFNNHFLQKQGDENRAVGFAPALQLQSMLPAIEKALKEQRIISFVPLHREVKPFHDFIISPSIENDVVDIFGIDVTAQKETEWELIQAKERAQESDRLKSAFLANMSHEIRTPLNAIVGFSDLLTETDDMASRKEFARIIKINNQLLLQLINDILDLAKIDAGTLEFHYSNVNLNELMENAKSTVSNKLQPGVVLNVVFGAAHCHINTEYNRLSQVLINLLTNACKFTKCGSITLGYRIKDKEIYFYVHDTGCGIPKDKLGKVFERFTKLNNFAQGTGLGLSICQNIIERMEGTITAESDGEGKGSTFSFMLPYLPAEAPEEENETPHIMHTEPDDTPENRKCVLVAEDSENNYELFNAILGNDYNLLHAWDGVEAVELFRRHRPDVIIMDITMPRMDGYEATQKIREQSATVPIIAVTANAFASDKERVLRNGFNAYMAKPIIPVKLAEEIRRMIG